MAWKLSLEALEEVFMEVRELGLRIGCPSKVGFMSRFEEKTFMARFFWIFLDGNHVRNSQSQVLIQIQFN